MTDYPHLSVPSAAKLKRRDHMIEWAEDTQYAVVSRIVRGLTPDQAAAALKGPKPKELRADPNAEEGWLVNIDHPSGGYEAVVPSWCKDGTAVMHKAYWLRDVPGMMPYQREAHLSIPRDPQ